MTVAVACRPECASISLLIVLRKVELTSQDEESFLASLEMTKHGNTTLYG
jgi:hypothetical protein